MNNIPSIKISMGLSLIDLLVLYDETSNPLLIQTFFNLNPKLLSPLFLHLKLFWFDYNQL